MYSSFILSLKVRKCTTSAFHLLVAQNRKASPAPPSGQEKPVSNHRNPPVVRERERERERVNALRIDGLCIHITQVKVFAFKMFVK